mgnify:FL=1|jgi:hypothetical protein
MSKIGVSLSLDVTKIDKSRLKEVTKKDGSVAKYLNLTTFINPTEEDQYGNHGFIAQSQTKEERESGAERPPILGNVKVIYTEGGQPKKQDDFLSDDVPF